MRAADRYYLKTSKGPITNDCGDVIKFNSYSDARHWAINHCDLSVKGLEIVDAYKCWMMVEA